MDVQNYIDVSCKEYIAGIREALEQQGEDVTSPSTQTMLVIARLAYLAGFKAGLQTSFEEKPVRPRYRPTRSE